MLANGWQEAEAMRNALTAAIGSGVLATLLATPAATGTFDNESVLDQTIEAPVAELFTHAEADEGYPVRGTLKWSGETGDTRVLERVSISERGHTSRRASKCDFPKLKLDLGST